MRLELTFFEIEMQYRHIFSAISLTLQKYTAAIISKIVHEIIGGFFAQIRFFDTKFLGQHSET